MATSLIPGEKWSIEIRAELARAVRAEAERERRSLRATVERILEQYFDAQQRDRPASPAA